MTPSLALCEVTSLAATAGDRSQAQAESATMNAPTTAPHGLGALGHGTRRRISHVSWLPTSATGGGCCAWAENAQDPHDVRQRRLIA